MIDLKLCNETYFKAREERKKANESKDYKICFECQKVREIKDFTDNNKKYQRPAGKKKNHLCNYCIEKRENGDIHTTYK